MKLGILKPQNDGDGVDREGSGLDLIQSTLDENHPHNYGAGKHNYLLLLGKTLPFFFHFFQVPKLMSIRML